MNQQRIRDYQHFLIEVLQATAESDGNSEVISPLLQANLDRLDNNFIVVLQNWAEAKLSEVEFSEAEYIANVIFYFSNLIQQFPLGNKATNIEISIAGYEISQTVFTRDSHPENWANIQNNLGAAYLYRISGDRAENLEKAIAACQLALQVHNYETFSINWAMAQNSLGLAYCDRISGDKAENLEMAIAAFQQALQVYTPEVFPIDWAQTQNYLGIAYCDRISGDRAENLEMAIAAYRKALQVRTKEALPIQWAMTQNNLSIVYKDRVSGDKAKNLEMAIAACKMALQVLTREALPINWAITQNNLGRAYLERISGDRAENLEMAIATFQQTLQVSTREAFPIDWAMTQNNLGVAYWKRISGSRAENLEMAIAAYEKALQVRTKKAFPIDWAMTQNNLAAAYFERISGSRSENLEMAIAAYEKALQVNTREAFPIDWALTQNNLGNAYLYRISGDTAENLEMAIAAYQKALQIRTREALPIYWADTQNNLGNAYCDRISGDKAENLERAIAAYQKALQVYTPEALRIDWAMTQNNLGEAYRKRISGDKAENLEMAIAAYQKALQVYTSEAFPINWARTQNNLGAAYSNRKSGDRAQNLEKTIAAYKLALEVRTREALPIDWATTQNNLGAAYSNRIFGDRADNLERAIAAYQKALQVRTKEALPIDWATTQNNLGAAYSGRISGDRAKNIEEAIAAYQKALQVRTKEADPITCLKTSRNLGNLHFTQGDWQRAIQAYETALQAVELMRQSAITERRRQEIIENAINVYQNLTQAYINTHNYPKAIQTAERSKARNLLELMANRDLYPKGNVPEEVLKELDRLRRLLENQTRELQSLNAENTGTQRPQPDTNPDNTGQTLTAPQQQQAQIQQARERLGEKIADTRCQLDALIEKDITPIDPNFSLTQKVETIPFEKIQGLTDDRQTAIIEWYVTAEKILTFILLPPLPQTDSSLLVREFGGEDLTKLIDFVNKYVQSYYSDPQHQQWREELEDNLQELADILHLDELVADIQQNFAASNQTCQQLILIPHRFLHIFPIHALPVKQPESTETPTAHLLDLFPGGVGYAPSCQLLHRVRAKQPAFDNLFAVQTPTPDLYKYDLGAVGVVKKQFRQAEILSKAAATKTALLKPDSPLSVANCLFFFCHGIFNPLSPVDSGLLLADATLTLGDIIAELDLRKCRLVTMSACETGLTEFTNTSDEYIGLPSGFMLAGSPNILGNLWTVEHRATTLLTLKFYEEERRCGNIVVALKNAQQWLRDSSIAEFREWVEQCKLTRAAKANLRKFFNDKAQERGETAKPFKSPFYWGAFCAIGKGV